MKHKYLNTIGQYFYYLLLAVSVVLVVLFYLNSGKANQLDSTTKQIADVGPILDYLFNWTYLLVALAVVLAIGLPIVNMVSNPKKGLKTLISFVIVAVVLIVAYQFSNGTPMNIVGYEGNDNIPSRLKLVDTAMFTMYAMIVLAVITVIYCEVSKLFK